MKVNLHYNVEIKAFDAWHLLLEAEVMNIKDTSKAYVAKTSFSIEKKKFKRNGFNKGEGSSSVKFKRKGKVQN